MKVKQLIKKLEGLPKNLEIYSADHDHGKFETSSEIGRVELIDKSEMDDIEDDNYCDGGYYPFKNTPKKYVVIRP